MRGTGALIVAAVLAAAPAQAGEITERQLDELMPLGSLAALAPLCGIREEGWAFDLRRAAIQSATRTQRHDDPGLKAAPDSGLAVSALSFAEAEALESFAEASPATTCERLDQHPDLPQADRMVRDFRAQQGALPGS